MNKILYLIIFLCFSSITLVSGNFGKVYNYNIIKGENTPFLKAGNSQILPELQDNDKNIFSDFKTFNFGINTTTGDFAIGDSTIKIIASGKDIGGINDDGYFLFKEIKGDFEISLKVHSLSPGNSNTKAGFMARQDLSDNSKNICFCIFPDNRERNNLNGGCIMQRRLKKGENSDIIYPNQQITENKFNISFLQTWIKFKREGNIFSAYISQDNLEWIRYTNYQQKMPKNILVGLVASSNNPNGYTIFEFSDFQLKTN